MATEPVVVFDLGGVLIDWNPRHLYRKLFDDESAMEDFLARICTPAWNLGMDAGRPFAEGIAGLVARHPGQAPLIEAYHARWGEMVTGAIEGSVRHLEALTADGREVFALTNWSAETFRPTRARFPFLDLFAHILVSGDVGLVKPDPAIYRLLLARIGRPAEACLFIDDSAANVAAAVGLGFDAIRFESPEQLGHALARRGLPHG